MPGHGGVAVEWFALLIVLTIIVCVVFLFAALVMAALKFLRGRKGHIFDPLLSEEEGTAMEPKATAKGFFTTRFTVPVPRQRRSFGIDAA